MSETTELTKMPEVVLPAMSGDQALEVWSQYQDLINKVCTPEDYQEIQGKKMRKKSGWRKIATFFNLSTSIVSQERHDYPNGDFSYSFVCKASAPNGRSAEGTGSCSAFEKATLKDGKFYNWDKYSKSLKEATPNSVHNVMTTAETRATNRAISNLVGGGEVSADEVTGDSYYDDEPPAKSTYGSKADTSQASIGGAYVKQPEPKPAPKATPKYPKCEECGAMGNYHRPDCSHNPKNIPGITTGDKIKAKEVNDATTFDKEKND